MSFTPEFAPDALSQWRALEFEFQELVLDKMESLVLDPPRAGEHVIDIVREDTTGRDYVFLRVFVDTTRARMSVIGVGHVRR